jgi:esterase/lipase
VGYNKIPVNIGPKVKMVIKEMKQSLSNITCPVLLFQGKHDSIIKKESMDRIYNSIKSSNKKKIWLENNDHSILGSPDQDIVVRKIIEFISNNS